MRPLRRLLQARWPWLLCSALVCVVAATVLLTFEHRETDARAKEVTAREYAERLQTPDELAPATYLLIEREPAIAEMIITSSVRALLADVGEIEAIAPAEGRQIRLALNDAAEPGTFDVRGAALLRASIVALHVAGEQRERADAAQREAIAGGVAALVFAVLVVALLLSRERRMTLAAARRHAAELEHVADHDVLTGLLARRPFERDLAAIGAQGTEPVELVVCDVNGLKAINDRHGHHAGDAVLVGAAESLRRVVGDAGRVYRTGGDEFCVISAPGTRVADLTREAFERTGSTVASIGAATWPTDSALATDVLRLADRRMYDAKRARRAVAAADAADPRAA